MKFATKFVPTILLLLVAFAYPGPIQAAELEIKGSAHGASAATSTATLEPSPNVVLGPDGKRRVAYQGGIDLPALGSALGLKASTRAIFDSDGKGVYVISAALASD